VQLWEAARIRTDPTAQVVRGARVQVPFPRDWEQQDAVAREAFLREFNQHMLPHFALYEEMGDLVFQLLEEQRRRAITAYLTLYPGEKSTGSESALRVLWVVCCLELLLIRKIAFPSQVRSRSWCFTALRSCTPSRPYRCKAGTTTM
jgi:hypothetical protein